MLDNFGSQLQVAGHLPQYGRAVELQVRLAGIGRVRLLPAHRGSGEDGFAHFIGRITGDHLKFAAVFQQFGQALMNELAGICAKDIVHILIQFAARATLPAAEQLQELSAMASHSGLLASMYCGTMRSRVKRTRTSLPVSMTKVP